MPTYQDFRHQVVKEPVNTLAWGPGHRRASWPRSPPPCCTSVHSAWRPHYPSWFG